MKAFLHNDNTITLAETEEGLGPVVEVPYPPSSEGWMWSGTNWILAPKEYSLKQVYELFTLQEHIKIREANDSIISVGLDRIGYSVTVKNNDGLFITLMLRLVELGILTTERANQIVS
jgi:hypothetical protein